MPCLLAILALGLPRVVVVILWLFSQWFSGMFSIALWPVLGFVFLPTTLLWYTAVQHWYGGHWTLLPVLGIVIALLIDMAPAASRRRRVVRG